MSRHRNSIARFGAAAGLLFMLSQANAECFVMVDRDRLVESDANGQEMLAGPKAIIDQLECVDPQVSQMARDRIEQLEELVREYPELTAKLVADIAAYDQLLGKFDAQAESSLQLASDYDDLTTRYDTLAGDYQVLVGEYDDLTEQYRDIALAGQTGISLDAGIGVTDDGDPAALLGIGYKKLRLWGTADEDRNAVFIGGSFPF